MLIQLSLGYLGFDTMDEYDVATCAQKCTDKFGCSSFNIYFERDPSREYILLVLSIGA
jgi:hypothetical protein